MVAAPHLSPCSVELGGGVGDNSEVREGLDQSPPLPGAPSVLRILLYGTGYVSREAVPYVYIYELSQIQKFFVTSHVLIREL